MVQIMSNYLKIIIFETFEIFEILVKNRKKLTQVEKKKFFFENFRKFLLGPWDPLDPFYRPIWAYFGVFRGSGGFLGVPKFFGFGPL